MPRNSCPVPMSWRRGRGSLTLSSISVTEAGGAGVREVQQRVKRKILTPKRYVRQ